AAVVEAKLREVTGLGDDWSFILNELDAEPSDKDYISFCFINNDVNGEGRTLTVGCEVNIKAAILVVHEHEWDAGYSFKQATMEEEGIYRYTCLTCGEIRDEVTPVLDHVPADINGDGKVTSKDLIRFVKYLSGVDVEVNEKALDVNGDGKINSKDLTRLLKYIAGEPVRIF
ncbi:MAG: dockerin type I repeat-containing protein, partial [Clostridia bacterium]|nr:dockerin type I repeat-containing protein [Clostridia bacterium]